MVTVYCKRCGHKLSPKMIDGRERLQCSNCGYVHFENPKVSAGVLIEKEGKVLLAKRARGPFADYWYLPSGYVEIDETTEEAARREAMEEICVNVEIKDLFAVLSYNDDPRGNGIIIIYYANIASGIPHPGDDVREVDFFSPNNLPEKLAFGHHRKLLAKWISRRKLAVPEAR